jgi:hypothetical protein
VKDVTILGDSKSVRAERLLDWVWRVEDDIELFECAVLGLWHGEPEDDGHHSIPDNEDDICLGRDVSKLLHMFRVMISLTFHPMFLSATGHANWPRRPPALTAKLEKAMPLARISKESTSTG